MAAYREHISVSGMLGVAYGAGAIFALGFTPVQGTLAGILTWVAGMLPDLDSDTGKPVREIFGLTAAVAPFVVMRHLLEWAGDAEGAMLLSVLLYASIRYGAASILCRLSVHRGMFHSVPALIIASELTFLGYKSESNLVKLLMAGGVAVGFFSHLLLDEMYSVEWSGIRVRLNSAAGSAIKLVGKKFLPNVVTYALLMVLTYATLLSVGLVEEPRPPQGTPTLQQAEEERPDLR
jgi:hypothetical protein